ncbi:MAG: thiamine-phosphate kinase [Candidatus Sericytochromatia bacterium]|nr:thiamine-phosphate kinase [Candidatus Tanganyikabacteria bacterium]
MRTLHELGETGAIALMSEILAGGRLPPGWLGPGDDTAITDLPAGMRVLTTCDVLVEGIHFRRETAPPEDLGWKALAVNVSDIHAMGGTAAWAVVGLCLPSELAADWLAGLYRGLAAAAAAYDAPVVGGDTGGSTGPIALSVTVVGYTRQPRLRADARPGDVLISTGPHGLSRAGLWALEHPGVDLPLDLRIRAERHHNRPELPGARAALTDLPRAALLDDSDGLGTSCRLLAEASGVALHLAPGRVPIDPVARAIAAAAGADPLAWALWGGEDYGLVAAVPAGTPLFDGWHVIGDVRAGAGVYMDGEPLLGMPYRHF